MSVKILGADPGLANFGYSVMRLGPRLGRVLSAGVLTSQKSDKKLNIGSASDNAKRTQLLAFRLENLIKAHKVKAICAESMSFPRNSSAAAKTAMAWGVILTLVEHYQLPLIQLSPQQVKLSVCGAKNASKDDIRNAIVGKYEIQDDYWGIPKTRWEHVFDSIAVLDAALESDVIRALRKGNSNGSTVIVRRVQLGRTRP